MPQQQEPSRPWNLIVDLLVKRVNQFASKLSCQSFELCKIKSIYSLGENDISKQLYLPEISLNGLLRVPPAHPIEPLLIDKGHCHQYFLNGPDIDLAVPVPIEAPEGDHHPLVNGSHQQFGKELNKLLEGHQPRIPIADLIG